MELVEKLSGMIDDELHDAEKYARCALKHKDSDPALGKTFYDLSNEEMRHASMLHSEAARIIEQYRRDNGEPPEAMLAVYNYLHDKQTDKALEVKRCQAMYRGE